MLCTATVSEGVPKWLENRLPPQGWVTAEYSLLPRSTNTRSRRERKGAGGRTQEIQRLIGRSLRAGVDMNRLGARSVIVDCDILEADGGTRTASITGGWLALIGPLLMTFLLIEVSGVAMLDAALVERRPGYADYIRSTPSFFPKLTPAAKMRPGIRDEAE